MAERPFKPGFTAKPGTPKVATYRAAADTSRAKPPIRKPKQPITENRPFGGGEQGPQLNRPCKVGSYKANPFGLYDMHGNVVEWCQDWFGDATYREKDRTDPIGPKFGQYRMLKGGTYSYDAQSCRTAYRNYTSPNSRDGSFGFRVACSLRLD